MDSQNAIYALMSQVTFFTKEFTSSLRLVFSQFQFNHRQIMKFKYFIYFSYILSHAFRVGGRCWTRHQCHHNMT